MIIITITVFFIVLFGFLMGIDIINNIKVSFILCLSSLVALVCLLICLGIFMNSLDYTETAIEIEKIKISAIKDNSNINGKYKRNLFVSSGHIDEKMYYYCIKDTDKGKIMVKYPADCTYIIESTVEPYVSINKKIYKSEKTRYWYRHDLEYEYYIYVPEGTVTNDFIIDME